MFTETTDFKILILINIYVDDAFTKRNSVIELVAYYCLSLSISQRNTGNKKHPHTHIYICHGPLSTYEVKCSSSTSKNKISNKYCSIYDFHHFKR